nr:UDP-3-O-(3-hydroxymyristoyl)glucosamine N-acyltransferase [Dissulfuribacter thermophilus]
MMTHIKDNDMKELTLKEISELVDGRLAGPEDLKIRAIAPLDQAGPGEISFAVGTRLKDKVLETRASALILPQNWSMESPVPSVFVKDPYLAFAKVLNFFISKPFLAKGVMEGARIGQDASIEKEVTIYPGAYIGDRVKIGKRVTIYPGVFIGDDCEIGDDSTIYANVTLYSKTVIGRRCIIHAGAVIGSDGFGFAQDGLSFVKIPQVGRVVIEDDCEIGANTTIDRATFGETRISKGTKIDNLVQIAHNCNIGENTIIVSQVGIAGSTSIGKNCMLGGQVGVVGHIKIGDRVKIGAQSGVAQSIPDDSIVSGSPAVPHRVWLKVSSLVKRLPELFKEVSSLKKAVRELKKEGIDGSQ